MDPLIYSIKFSVKGHDVNGNKFLTIPALLKKMQEASLQHARQLKASVWDMAEEKMTWVLVRKELKIIKPLKLDSDYTILTYPSGFDKFLAYRDYLVFDSDKKLVVGASSTWTLLHTESRKLVKFPKKILDIGVPKDTRFLVQPEKSIDLPDYLVKTDQRLVRPYDLDWNNHINNIVLIRYIMESIKKDGVEDESISKILVHFKNELTLNESVNVFQSKQENHYFSCLKELETNRDIVLCKISLK
jgi:medium-chain acyl-[acyl-carrier-protein] hydrolase